VYEIVELVGTGRESQVYRASTAEQEQVALKLFHREVPRERIFRQIRHASSVSSNHIVRHHSLPGHWNNGDRYFAVMEYVEGGTLRKRIETGERADPASLERVASGLMEALEAMPDLFLRYGGHRQAAGVALPLERVEEFRRRLNEYAAARLKPEDFRPSLELDGTLELGDLDDGTIAELLALAPFGHGNPPPLLAIVGAEVAGPATLFKERHLRFTLRQGRNSLTVKAWDFAQRAAQIQPGALVDVAVNIEADPFAAARGYPGWSATVRDLRPSQQTV